MAERSLIQFILQGIDQTAQATKSSAANLNKIVKATNALQSIALVALAKRAASTTIELTKMGADSLKTRDRLVAFAGGTEQADAMLQSLNAASDNTIDRMSGMAMATSLIEQGLVSTTSEMEMAAAMVAKLGRAGLSTEGRMNSLTMMLSNQSTRRLDDFGLSVETVTTRQAELEAQGMSTTEAFSTAVFEQAGVKLGILGDQSETAATKIGQLEAAWTSYKQLTGETLAAIVAQAAGTENLGNEAAIAARTLELVNEKVKSLGPNYQFARGEMEALHAEMRKLAELGPLVSNEVDRYKNALVGINPEIERYAYLSLQAAEANDFVAKSSAQQWEEVQASRAVYQTFAGFAEQRAQNKLTEAAAVESANQRMAQSTASMAQQTAGIYASLAALELSHASRMEAIANQGGGGGGGRKSMMGEISKAQSKELEALQAKFDERDWQKSLEGMAEDHEERLAKIRDDAGLDSRNALNRSLTDEERAEIQRYTDQRDAAIARREQQKSDEAERLAIIKKYDKRRRAEQAAAEGASAGQAAAAQQAQLEAEVASYEAQKEALNTRLAEAAVQHSLILEEHKDLLDTILKYAERTKERMDAIARRDAQVSGEPGAPRRYAGGTSYHPGGAAWVGEREPELLQLPTGSRVTPMSKMGGGITIINHFGRDSIRSDRDIVLLERRQKQSLRLRGRAN